jgi:hypothetical protein
VEYRMNGYLNAAIVREGLEAYTRGELTRLSGLFADNAVWHAMGPKAIAGDYRGRDAIFDFFARVLEETGRTFRIQVQRWSPPVRTTPTLPCSRRELVTAGPSTRCERSSCFISEKAR